MYYRWISADITDFIGKTVQGVVGTPGDEAVTFVFTDGSAYQMFHNQECCENVEFYDSDTPIQNLIGETILDAYESVSGKWDDDDQGAATEDYVPESYTWTFYVIRTNLFTVTMRWYGTSNGWYSETVQLVQTRSKNGS